MQRQPIDEKTAELKNNLSKIIEEGSSELKTSQEEQIRGYVERERIKIFQKKLKDLPVKRRLKRVLRLEPFQKLSPENQSNVLKSLFDIHFLPSDGGYRPHIAIGATKLIDVRNFAPKGFNLVIPYPSGPKGRRSYFSGPILRKIKRIRKAASLISNLKKWGGTYAASQTSFLERRYFPKAQRLSGKNR